LLQQIYRDQLGRKISINHPPKRIISLVPSLTEFIADLGLSDNIVGITKFCVHPKEVFRSKTRVGGTKDFNLQKIINLSPDLIICNKEENEKLKVEELAKLFPVYISNIINLKDAFEMMQQLGDILGKTIRANEIIAQCRLGFQSIHLQKSINEKQKVLYLIWKKPYMAAGTDTFINAMLEEAGFANIINTTNLRYPEISEAEIIALAPDLVMLSSEPYPFKQKHIEDLQHILPDSKIMLVDGEIFSWYGSRLLRAGEYLRKLKNQE
jgi:ABC-type Fe3+-hydroxamate transport system substrate-binding protein